MRQTSWLWSYVGSSVFPFCLLNPGVPLLKLSTRKKGTLITEGLLGNLGYVGFRNVSSSMQSLQCNVSVEVG